MADELLDLVDKDGIVIDTASRDECHSNPDLIMRLFIAGFLIAKVKCCGSKDL